MRVLKGGKILLIMPDLLGLPLVAMKWQFNNEVTKYAHTT
jgi:hypothetical protein